MTNHLTIFEGPDCGGKSTLANFYLSVDGGTLIHHGPYLNIKHNLVTVYEDAIQPLIEGKESQVWDRCWLSEPIYGNAFRDGHNRIWLSDRRQLEKAAAQYNAIVVLCLPPWETVKAKWLDRKGLDSDNEMLDRVAQLRVVYDGYVKLSWNTSLPVIMYDYTKHNKGDVITAIIARRQGVK